MTTQDTKQLPTRSTVAIAAGHVVGYADTTLLLKALAAGDDGHT